MINKFFYFFILIILSLSSYADELENYDLSDLQMTFLIEDDARNYCNDGTLFNFYTFSGINHDPYGYKYQSRIENLKLKNPKIGYAFFSLWLDNFREIHKKFLHPSPSEEKWVKNLSNEIQEIINKYEATEDLETKKKLREEKKLRYDFVKASDEHLFVSFSLKLHRYSLILIEILDYLDDEDRSKADNTDLRKRIYLMGDTFGGSPHFFEDLVKVYNKGRISNLKDTNFHFDLDKMSKHEHFYQNTLRDLEAIKNYSDECFLTLEKY